MRPGDRAIPRASVSTETPSWPSGASGNRSKPKIPSTTWRTTHWPVAGSMSYAAARRAWVESRLELRWARTDPSSAMKLSNRLSIVRSGKPGLERMENTTRATRRPWSSVKPRFSISTVAKRKKR